MTTAVKTAWDEAFRRGFSVGVRAEGTLKRALKHGDTEAMKAAGLPERGSGFLAGARAGYAAQERHPLATPEDLERALDAGRKL